MHRLVNRSIEVFLRDTYGERLWEQVADASGVDARGFLPNRPYPETRTHALIRAATAKLDKPEAELLEDLGAWLARLESIRRLLRFSGRDFREFLLNLFELPDHVLMVIPDLGMPRITVTQEGDDGVRLRLPGDAIEWTSAIAGIVRAMADDYGALGLIEVEGTEVRVRVLDGAFSEGRDFQLGGEAEAKAAAS